MPKFADMTSLPIFFDVVIFVLSSLVTDPGFMLISQLVLELWRSEIQKLEIPQSEFCPISGDWGELGDNIFDTNVSNKMSTLRLLPFLSYYSDLCVIIMSRTRFSVNLQSIVAWMSRNSLLETGMISDV